MWRRQSTLVFLTVAVAAMVVSGQDPVILDDNHTEEVKLPPGSKLIFKCNFCTTEFERFVVEWYFNHSGPSLSTTDCFNRSTPGQHSGNILLNHSSHATKENSGWYSCKVTAEIPHLQKFESQGRFVNIMKSVEHTTYPSLVTDKQGDDTDPNGRSVDDDFTQTATVSPEGSVWLTDWWLWIALGVSTVILIVLLIMCMLLRRRYRNSRAEDPIYVNTHPKQPSPLPLGHQKKASSTQSLQKPNRNPGKIDRDKQRYR